MPLYAWQQSWSKQELFERTCILVDEFLSLNGYLTRPKIITGSAHGCYGKYSHGTCTIDFNLCKNPVKVPGYSWTFPGYKADLTTAGVTAHEVGHFVYERCSSDVHTAWRKLTWNTDEPTVSSYAPDDNEDFAECFKLLITNPDLLQHGRRLRWNFITKQMGILPPRSYEWKEVLSDANKRIVAAASNWIKKGISAHEDEK